jgi:hypothetical protein
MVDAHNNLAGTSANLSGPYRSRDRHRHTAIADDYVHTSQTPLHERANSNITPTLLLHKSTVNPGAR